MPMTQRSTSWSVDELFTQATASVSDDTRWLIQTQSSENLVLRREKGLSVGKTILVIGVALFTFGLGLILLAFFLADLRNQQIAIGAKTSNNITAVTITYTSGASSRVNTLLSMMP